MIIKTCKVTDYSTGTEYRYTDNTGSWKSIQAAGGSVYSSGSPNGNVQQASPSQTIQQSGVAVPPAPFSNFRTETAQNPQRTGWPWQANGDKTQNKYTKASGSSMSDDSGDAEVLASTSTTTTLPPSSKTKKSCVLTPTHETTKSWKINKINSASFFNNSTTTSGTGPANCSSSSLEVAPKTYNNGFYTPYTPHPSPTWSSEQAAQTYDAAKKNSINKSKQKSGAVGSGMNRAHAYPIVLSILSVLFVGYIL